MPKNIADTGSINRALSQCFATRESTAISVLGLAGIFIGFVLALQQVSVGSGVTSAECGSVFVPSSDVRGNSAPCGQALSVHAIRAGTLSIGGLLYVVYRLLSPKLNRALLVMAITLAASLLLNFSQPEGSWFDFALLPYPIGLGVLTWKRSTS